MIGEGQREQRTQRGRGRRGREHGGRAPQSKILDCTPGQSNIDHMIRRRRTVTTRAYKDDPFPIVRQFTSMHHDQPRSARRRAKTNNYLATNRSKKLCQHPRRQVARIRACALIKTEGNAHESSLTLLVAARRDSSLLVALVRQNTTTRQARARFLRERRGQGCRAGNRRRRRGILRLVRPGHLPRRDTLSLPFRREQRVGGSLRLARSGSGRRSSLRRAVGVGTRSTGWAAWRCIGRECRLAGLEEGLE
jgi:hypothetical protein